MKKALKATVHGAAFNSVAKNAQVVLAVEDIEDDIFWRAIFCLLRVVFSALKALQFFNFNHNAMEKV